MKLSEILSEMNITFDKTRDNLFDYILHSKDTITLDIFPNIIDDNKKYQSVEVFYQRVLDNSMNKQDFMNIENCFIKFINILWLYSDTYINVISSEIKSNYYYKKNRKSLRKYIDFIAKCSKSDDYFHVDDIDILNSLITLATRDISPIIFYFKNSKTLLLLNGCMGLVYPKSPENILYIKQIANNCSLFLY